MKKISPPPSVLSRSSKMKAMAVVSGFPAGSNRVQKSKTSMTLEELTDDISRYYGGRTCTFVMGASCAEGGTYNPNIPFDQQSIYGKWRMAGGKCPEGDQLDDNCSSRCRGPTGDFISTYVCR